MPIVSVGKHDFCYEISGDGEPLLLIMGLGGQLTDWPKVLVDKLAAKHQVVLFDNRDSGLSSKTDGPAPTRWELIKGNIWPRAGQPSYALTDMADDAAGLLDALGIAAAHVVGMSMGGMIAQQLTMRHPDKVTSLCSIMSNTGNRRQGRPTARVVAALGRRGEPSRANALEAAIRFFRIVGGPDWSEDEQRARTAVSLERSYYPAGVLRQAQAIAAAEDRTGALTRVGKPTLVIHGLHDQLVRPSGGVATSEAVPDSRLLLFPGMGHDLPTTRHDEIAAAIVRNAGRAKQQAREVIEP